MKVQNVAQILQINVAVALVVILINHWLSQGLDSGATGPASHKHRTLAMKAQQFQEWMHRTGCRSAADVVRLLDIGRNTAQAMVAEAEAGQDLQIKRTVALAMTAVANGLRPWDDYER